MVEIVSIILRLHVGLGRALGEKNALIWGWFVLHFSGSFSRKKATKGKVVEIQAARQERMVE